MLEAVRDADARVRGGKVTGVAGDEWKVFDLGRGEDDGVGELEAGLAAEEDGAGGDLLGDGQVCEGAEKGEGGGFEGRGGSGHDLHPGDDADGAAGVALEFAASLFAAEQVVDEDVGVEEAGASYHSALILSW